MARDRVTIRETEYGRSGEFSKRSDSLLFMSPALSVVLVTPCMCSDYAYASLDTEFAIAAKDWMHSLVRNLAIPRIIRSHSLPPFCKI